MYAVNVQVVTQATRLEVTSMNAVSALVMICPVLQSSYLLELLETVVL